MQSEFTERRVTLHSAVEPFTMLGGERPSTTPEVYMRISYDLGSARGAMADLDYAYQRLVIRLEQAIAGENRERSERVESAAHDRQVMKSEAR